MNSSSNTTTKRSQRDYTMGFKLAVVAQVEKGEMTYKQAQDHYGIQGRSTVLVWLRKHGKLDWSKPIEHSPMSKSKETPAQKIKRLEKALANAEMKNMIYGDMVELLKDDYGIDLGKKVLSRTLWLAKEQGKVKLASACKQFNLSRQSVYQWKQRLEARVNELLPVKGMVMYWRQYMPRVGTRKLYQLIKPQLEGLGIKLGRDGLFKYLKSENMLVKPRKNYTKTTNSRHWLRKHPNLLKGKAVNHVEEVVVSDITYVKTDEGTHYLSLVTDAYSRKILGYELSNEMKASDVVKALDMTIMNRQTNAATIHHSDRGLQYCSSEYQEKLNANGMVPSMTDGYDCYQNALAERVNGILKSEFLLYQCNTMKELTVLVKESISIYNDLRPHMSLGMKTPSEVHEKASKDYLLAS
ncbi:IS3 family transposase [Vibrio jasicida]|uniref:IS3 family transposase n=1 Tax=Vibrio jasicida TaxID=766224 RepID=UPI000CE4C381|nr:IS3 family transposase [Vibrio jasicida]